MSRFVCKLEGQQNNFYALGGIGTGFVKLYQNGLVCACDSERTEKTQHYFPASFFAIKAKGKDTKPCVKVLCDDENVLSDSISSKVTGFDKSDMTVSFPFANKEFYSQDFPARVTLTSFSPFLPLNDTDSSIPAAFFEYSVENISDTEKEFSLCAVVNNLFQDGENKVGCSENGTAYICMQGDNNSSLCIATDEKNVSYKETLDIRSFFEEFYLNDTLVNQKEQCTETKYAPAALCTHFTLEKGQAKTIKFVLTWHFPYCLDGHKTYYSQYFAGSYECASYCFLHRNRLMSETKKFTDTLNGSTFPYAVLEHINKAFEKTRKLDIVRHEDGILAKTKENTVCTDNVYALRYLFPKLSKHMLLKIITDAFDNDTVMQTESMCVCVIKLYRDYTLDADYEQLIENWYYIAKFAQALFFENHKNEYTHIEKLALYLCCKLAQEVKDRRRFNEYTKKYDSMSVNDTSLTSKTLLHIDECGLYDLYKDKEPVCTENANVYTLSSVMFRRQMIQKALSLLEENTQSSDFLCAYSLINAINGFEYDAKTAQICFDPIMEFANDGTFKGFFCVDTGFGYVERGIDYIEINMVRGSVNVKSFKVPKLSRMVLYGGRHWKFTAEKNTAVLDSTLKITPDKKLTVIIDV